ncbi:MAG: nicotinate-nucleotide adenylyltransferase [Candidatus Ancillula sp.]|nr:nicotinate-nucleotide adenylyltransferase [Candidatus Ancillula sp.]
MLVGVLGGTFNPVHNGHLAVAQQVCDKLELDKLLLVPTYATTVKNSKSILPPDERLKMLYMALEDCRRIKNIDKIQISQVDINRNRATYTYDTLIDLHKEYADAKFYFLLGEDIANDLKSWKNAEKLDKLAKFIIVSRRNIKNTESQYRVLQIESLPISSNMIRERVANGMQIDNLVPKSVSDYIKKMNFWKEKA